jgi:glutaredoxin
MKTVKFVQPSCVPCKMVDALLNHLGHKVDQTLDIVTDEDAYALAEKIGVKSTPTIILFDDNGNYSQSVDSKEGRKSFFLYITNRKVWVKWKSQAIIRVLIS